MVPFAMGGAPAIGSLLTQPQVPARGIAPQDPNQVGLWGKFQERLKQDPNLQMALLTTGLNLLRSPQPGQSGFDVFSDAALTGVSTLDQLRQRDIAGEAATREEGREYEKLDIAKEGVDVRREAAEAATGTRTRQLNMQGNQFKEQIDLAREKFEEDQRQFNEKLKAGVLDSGGQITGTERLVNAGVDALVTAFPDVYPNTEEGRARARIRAQGLDASGDPLAQARVAAGLYSDLAEQNTFLDEDQQLTQDEMMEQAINMTKSFAGDPLSQGTGEATATADPLVNARVTHPAYGGGVLESVGEGKYRIRYDSGSLSGELTAEQVQQVLERKSGQP